MDPSPEYNRYKRIFKGQRMPLAFVDLDKFDRNIDYVASTQAATGKTIRVHTKSIRCLELTRRIFERGGDAYRGIMDFSVEETAYLAKNGFDDFIVAYPTVQPSDLKLFCDLSRQGVNASLMVDSMDQIHRINEAGRAQEQVLNLCLELDMAYRPMNTGTHLGLRRSPLRRADQVAALALEVQKLDWVRISAMMGYEGHIAGPCDNVPGQWARNRLLRFLKKRSIREFSKRRTDAVEALQRAGADLEVVNGGGSGSLVSTGQEDVVTEVTAGSAFYAPATFWHYKEVSFVPSAFFAVQVVRTPKQGMVTCQGGGYTASGPAGKDALPVPVYPEGLSLLDLEGAGEVQTPLQLPRSCPELAVGDPVFFQHAKGGELCERFNELYLVRDNEVVDCVKTYRGDGYAFI